MTASGVSKHVFYYSLGPCKSLENGLFLKEFRVELTEKMNVDLNSYPAHIVLKDPYQMVEVVQLHGVPYGWLGDEQDGLHYVATGLTGYKN